MLKTYNCDFHIHTCLSPCAELDMHPQPLVKKALEANLDIIALCDHNSSENTPFVIKAAQGTNLSVLPGMAITTSEEVHLLAIFDSLENQATMQRVVYAHLAGENDEKLFGVQAIVNESGEVEEINNRLLIGATDLPLNEVINYIHEFNGLAIAAHIDRESFSVLGQLGFIDKKINFDALEVTSATGFKQARKKYPELSLYSFIVSSDSHYIKDLGTARTRIVLDQVSVPELNMAFKGKNGRMVLEEE